MRACLRHGTLTPLDYWEMTRKETLIYIEAMNERRLDVYEDYSSLALMQRVATNKKTLKREDLFKRPKKGDNKVVSLEEKRKTLDELDKALGFKQKGG